jgi:glutamate-1-semialdehyde 2,1-aminomutase
MYGFETRRSRELSDRLQRSLPGGDTRSITYSTPYPIAIESGTGCRLYDVDGNEYAIGRLGRAFARVAASSDVSAV